ncbi:hypothetical protein [Chengkuizengella axinellae]|uniref:Uncharacterized protein n=1 Tax=Chengkuizengella axinellae TaxID=3064388 RepID=A0ABT9J624_9BACL|nr:hypothetical protein [Chengkuizengella sp. 2205SS18-9]MDP5277073.1 hypothetical protein [Chengkuizengella sp. 2205SS18-9]
MKKALSLVVAIGLFLSITNVYAINNSITIPDKMEPNTIITFDEDLSIQVEDRQPIQLKVGIESNDPIELGIVLSDEEIAELEAKVKKIKEEAKDLPHYKVETVLPTPFPGMKVTYGSDGKISHILNPDGTEVRVPLKTHDYPGVGERAQIGTYEYDGDQKITITSGSVLGEGTFTVFRAGVGGSNDEGRGSSGKILEAGDVATKWEYDNPNHNTPIDARALDTNIFKVVYKNDIGTLPHAVLDIYFWGYNNQFFGYMYDDYLSFPGRYYYEY